MFPRAAEVVCRNRKGGDEGGHCRVTRRPRSIFIKPATLIDVFPHKGSREVLGPDSPGPPAPTFG